MKYEIDALKLQISLGALEPSERGDYMMNAVNCMLMGVVDEPWIVSQPKKKGERKARNVGYSTEFETFWKEYPSSAVHGKPGKGAAWLAWDRIKADKAELCAACLNALEWQKKSEKWTADRGKYIPHPTTYLHQRRWEDEAPIVIIKKPSLGDLI